MRYFWILGSLFAGLARSLAFCVMLPGNIELIEDRTFKAYKLSAASDNACQHYVLLSNEKLSTIHIKTDGITDTLLLNNPNSSASYQNISVYWKLSDTDNNVGQYLSVCLPSYTEVLYNKPSFFSNTYTYTYSPLTVISNYLPEQQQWLVHCPASNGNLQCQWEAPASTPYIEIMQQFYCRYIAVFRTSAANETLFNPYRTDILWIAFPPPLPLPREATPSCQPIGTWYSYYFPPINNSAPQPTGMTPILANASNNHSDDSWTQNTKKRKPRTHFTQEQAFILEEKFKLNPYIDHPHVALLADNTGLSEETIKVWFQNKRARGKRQTKKLEGNLSTLNAE